MFSKVNKVLRKLEEYVTLILSFLIGLVFYRKKYLGTADIKRIVVIKLDHIGDVVLSIPAIANLRAQFPKSHISMVVNPSSEQIARLIPYIDEISCYSAKFFDRSGNARTLDFSRGLQFALEMRRKRFDLIVDLRGSFASLFFALIAKSDYRIDRGTYLVHRKLCRMNQTEIEHEAEVNLDIIARFGIPIRSREASLSVSKDNSDEVARLVGEFVETFNIVIHPGGPMELKRWSISNYAELICRLLERYSARVLLIGSKSESTITQAIASILKDNRVTDLSGCLTLGHLTALLKKSDIFVGNDSGPMHIASACGIKVVGLFGPTNPKRFSPYGTNCITIRMERNCPPCSHEVCRYPGYRCIDQISVDYVMDTVERMIDDTAPKNQDLR